MAYKNVTRTAAVIRGRADGLGIPTPLASFQRTTPPPFITSSSF